jgi:hypothetical protein
VEQPPQSRSTPAPPNAPRPPADGSGSPAAGSSAPSTAPAGRVCPTCGEPRQAEARYCEECGYDFGTDPPPPVVAAPAVESSRLSGPVLWLVIVFWAVLAVAGLYFLYTALYAL